MKIQSKFTLNFIDRTLRASGLLLLISFVVGMYYYGFWPSLSFFSGGVWGMVNLMFLKRFITQAFRPEAIDMPTVLVLGLIKFPLLYISGYFLISIDQISPVFALLGFSMILAVMILKAIGKVLIDDESGKQDQEIQKVF